MAVHCFSIRDGGTDRLRLRFWLDESCLRLGDL
jgi:hypothetical protein